MLFFTVNNIPLLDCITCYLSILHCLSNVYGQWVCFHLLAITTMLLWIFIYNILCKHMLLFLLGVYLDMELLGQIIIFLTFWGTARLLSKVAALFYIPVSSMQGSISPHFSQCWLLSVFLLQLTHKILIILFSRYFITEALFCRCFLYVLSLLLDCNTSNCVSCTFEPWGNCLKLLALKMFPLKKFVIGKLESWDNYWIIYTKIKRQNKTFLSCWN